MSAWARGVALAIGMSIPATMASGADRMFPTIGQSPNPALLEAWDIDVAPDGAGAPAGRGSALEGEEIYFEKCASCHGDFGEGVRQIVALVGGEDTLQDERPTKTIGSFWPYAATIFDYTKRTMPFGASQSLSNDEVYAVTAYLLYQNELIDEETVLGPDNIGGIEMPAKKLFSADPRPDVQPVQGEPCMSDCPIQSVIGRAKQVDVLQETKN